MNKLMFTTSAILLALTAGCATTIGKESPPAKCGVEEMYTKEGFKIIDDQSCVPAPVVIPETPVVPPLVPETPAVPDQEKSDNSDANGKGGNHHDRTDKDKDSQEIAEDRKAEEG